MEVKPICVMYFDQEILRSNPVHDLNRIRMVMEEKMPDYHVICITSENAEESVRLEVFHPKDFTEVQYEELKNIINEAIQNFKTT